MTRSSASGHPGGRPALLGIDLDTSSAKAVVTDLWGAPIGQAVGTYPVSQPRPDGPETDPQAWLSAAVAAVQVAPARAGQLSGRFATEPSDASARLLDDLPGDGWDLEILDALGLDPDKQAPLRPSSGHPAGELTAVAARLLDLPAGLPGGCGLAACVADATVRASVPVPRLVAEPDSKRGQGVGEVGGRAARARLRTPSWYFAPRRAGAKTTFGVRSGPRDPTARCDAGPPHDFAEPPATGVLFTAIVVSTIAKWYGQSETNVHRGAASDAFRHQQVHIGKSRTRVQAVMTNGSHP